MRPTPPFLKAAITSLTAITVALAVVACATPKPTIRANTAPGFDPAAYRSYSFAEHPGTDRGGVSTPLTAYFKDALRREMDSRGFEYKDSGGELLVNFNANARETVDIRSTPGSPAPVPYGYYGYRGMYGYGVGTGPDIETDRYRVGTANVDVVDVSKSQLVWEGLAEGRLTDKAMKNPAKAVSAVVQEMFRKFPAQTPATENAAPDSSSRPAE
jgi:hypothetical protein